MMELSCIFRYVARSSPDQSLFILFTKFQMFKGDLRQFVPQIKSAAPLKPLFIPWLSIGHESAVWSGAGFLVRLTYPWLFLLKPDSSLVLKCLRIGRELGLLCVCIFNQGFIPLFIKFFKTYPQEAVWVKSIYCS